MGCCYLLDVQREQMDEVGHQGDVWLYNILAL